MIHDGDGLVSLGSKLRLTKMRLDGGNFCFWQVLMKKLLNFNEVIHLIQRLMNKGLRERHWNSIKKAIDRDIFLSCDTLQLDNMFSLGLNKYMALFINLSLKANKELSINFLLLEMKDRWEKFPLYIASYKDTHKLNSTKMRI